MNWITPGSKVRSDIGMSLDVSQYNSFKKRSERKTAALQKKMWEQIERLCDDPQYPSLRVKKVRGTGRAEIWEASIDMAHRITFEYNVDCSGIILRNCNGHEVFDQP